MIGKIHLMPKGKDGYPKSFCFIKVQGQPDVFLHREEFMGNWRSLFNLTNQKTALVEFDLIDKGRGPRAKDCKIIQELE